MKPFTMYILSALTLLATKAALASAPVCDLSIAPEIAERQNEMVVHTIKGNRDNLHNPGRMLGNVMGAILLAPAIPVTFPYFTTGRAGDQSSHRIGGAPRNGISGRMSDARSSGRNSEAWYTEQTQEVTLKCYNYIRENFADDIISDNGNFVVARHYRCGEPYIYSYRHFNKVSVDVLSGDPVYTEMTAEQAIAQKCEKLTQCIINANTTTEIEQLQQTQIQLGCQ